MDKIMSAEDAMWLVSILSVFGIPFAITRLQNVNWPGIYKFFIAIGLCIVVGSLHAYAEGKIDQEATIVRNISIIFMFSQMVYQTLFKHLGWEKYISSKAALLTYASEQVKQDISNISEEKAQKIMDPANTTELSVQTTVTNRT